MTSFSVFSAFAVILLQFLTTPSFGKPHTGVREQMQYDSDGLHEIFTSSQWDSSPYGDFIGSGEPIDWQKEGEKEIERSLNMMKRQLEKPAKNVIFFIGDGMGVATISAARVYHAQQRQLPGDDVQLAWDKMDHIGLSMTYNTDRFVADSAGTATAFLCGEKAQYGTVGVNQYVLRGNCSSQAGNDATSVIHKAIEAGKSTGVVTTTRITHATPAATYAHSADRNWEGVAPEGCRDIAKQLIEDDINRRINVIMGGGRINFLPNTTADVEDETEFGTREDGRNLLEEWQENMKDEGFDEEEAVYIIDQEGFDEINIGKVERVLALFNAGHMNYESDRANDTFGEPSLTEMVKKSIEILSRDEDGYMLFVEGGRVDHAHHGNNAYRALDETVSLSDAVNAAMEATDPDDTLIIVSADHSHVMSISGSPRIAQNILGYDEEYTVGDDDLPYQTLSYANGPGYYIHRTENGSLATEQSRMDLSLSEEAMENPDWIQDAGVPLGSETHGGEEVAIYSNGPMSQLIHGTHQQSYIAHVILYATCIEGPDDMPHCYPLISASRGIHQGVLGVVQVVVAAILYRALSML